MGGMKQWTRLVNTSYNDILNLLYFTFQCGSTDLVKFLKIIVLWLAESEDMPIFNCGMSEHWFRSLALLPRVKSDFRTWNAKRSWNRAQRCRGASCTDGGPSCYRALIDEYCGGDADHKALQNCRAWQLSGILAGENPIAGSRRSAKSFTANDWAYLPHELAPLINSGWEMFLCDGLGHVGLFGVPQTAAA